MTFAEKLHSLVSSRGPGLCVGLDPDPVRMPADFNRDLPGIAAFLQKVILVTAPFAAAYKVNTAFFEALGSPGWRLLEEISFHLPEDCLRIADAKRGDIGNTAQKYAEAFFKQMPFDALTVNPYLGGDSLQPFLNDPTKGAYVLALTTNPGSKDLQYFGDDTNKLFFHVLSQIPHWAPSGNLGAVVGATHPEELLAIRRQFPSIPLLLPGVGAQGGDTETIRAMPYGAHHAPVLVNISRGILYPQGGANFPDNIVQACHSYQHELGII
ncbi:MAG TPA: orotidine-5'-phosphate decarboxylase [bacterium]